MRWGCENNDSSLLFALFRSLVWHVRSVMYTQMLWYAKHTRVKHVQLSWFTACRHLNETAFPSKEQIEFILDALSGTSTDGMTIDDLQERCNLRRGQIENALKFLAAEEVPPIRRVLFITISITCQVGPWSATWGVGICAPEFTYLSK